MHDEWVVQCPLHCHAANIQRFVQVHGSGGNYTDGTRRTYVLAYRNADAVARERALGFDHSHNTNFNWDKFASPALPLIFFVTLWSGTTTGLSTLRLQTRRALATLFQQHNHNVFTVRSKASFHNKSCARPWSDAPVQETAFRSP